MVDGPLRAGGSSYGERRTTRQSREEETEEREAQNDRSGPQHEGPDAIRITEGWQEVNSRRTRHERGAALYLSSL